MHWSQSRLQKDSVCMWQLCAAYMVFALQWAVWVNTFTLSHPSRGQWSPSEGMRLQQVSTESLFVLSCLCVCCVNVSVSDWFAVLCVLSYSFSFIKGLIHVRDFPSHAFYVCPDRLAGSLTHSLYDVKRR